MSSARSRGLLGLGVIAALVAAPLSALPAAAAGGAKVVVNEVETSSDWVELTNVGDVAADLSDFVLKDDNNSRNLRIPAGTVLEPGAFLAIDVDVPGGFGLGRADEIRLFEPDGSTLVDGHRWTEHPSPTYGRCPDGTGEFVTTVAATKGAPNACTVDPADVVVVNEVVSTGGQPGDWVELKNTGTVDVDVSGLVLQDNNPRNRYTIPAGTTIAAGGYLVLEEAAFGFGLGGADSAILYAADGTTVIDRHDWTAHAPTSWGRCADGVGEFRQTVQTTKGAVNDCPASEAGAVVVNEVESNGDATDWVELYNTGDTAVDVSGFLFRDNDVTRAPYALPAGSIIQPGGFYVIDQAVGIQPGFDFGLGANDEVHLFEPDGATLVASYAWTTHAPVTYGRCPDGSGDMVATSVSTKGAPNDCALPVRINEVESQNGQPGDWIELVNVGATVADLGGLTVTDNNPANRYTIPAGTTLAPGAYLVLDEVVAGAGHFDFGLGGNDAVRLLDGDVVIDEFAWTSHAATTYGRCPDGTGAFETTLEPTKGAANRCEGVLLPQPWPGGTGVEPLDAPGTFSADLSGLDFEGFDATGGVLWAVENGNGLLFRIVPDGQGGWAPDTAEDWAAGAVLRYTDGTGTPDAEGVTVTDAGAAEGVYVATERNNAASSVSRPAVLRYDVTRGGGELTATAEWNLAADFPGLGANQGLEGITWISDEFLVERGFVDHSGDAYDPNAYPGHGDGLFFVGVEGTAAVYAYALMADGSFERVVTIETGFSVVADVQFDHERSALWIVCDNACDGRTAIYEIAMDGEDAGRFVATAIYERPSGTPNYANEGFAIAPQAQCVDGLKSTFYADDSDTGGHSLRRGTIECTPLEEPGEPGGENPGGENPGGENPGGENPGGENPGGENPGGENPGGENPGQQPGEQPGPGQQPGGELPGTGGPAEPRPADEGDLTDATRGSILVDETVVAGSAVTIRLGAELAGQDVHVWLHSTPVLLASVTVGADGVVSVRIPADTPLGAHRIVVTSATDGSVLAWADVRVVAPGPAALAATGGAPAGIVWVGGVLGLLGLAAFAATRARQRGRQVGRQGAIG
ncbi:lamin tail domain-containing protein [Microbacterium album]|uniref:LTD domain-containing protein n=1 Tax=Microbacterium album TaxID=2053191 RepID=A0A917IEE6_9MICO|nr:lamin tail domain-containing protein [Microbacterium album]GGH37997.1 hypothetical protein GCM10010921_08330 [Microbacterium album]